jgi:ABC-type transporter MlaC component
MKKFLSLMSLCLLASSAWSAADLSSQGRVFVEDLVNVARQSQTSSGALSAEAQQKIKKVSEQIDFLTLAKAAWGAKWNSFKASDRKDFMAVLQELLETVAYPKAQKISADLSDMEFKNLPKSQVGVSGRVTREKRGEVISEKFNLTLIFSKDRKKIVDAVVDGEKVSANLNRQLNEALKKKSFPEIIAQMKKRVSEAKTKNAPSA